MSQLRSFIIPHESRYYLFPLFKLSNSNINGYNGDHLYHYYSGPIYHVLFVICALTCTMCRRQLREVFCSLTSCYNVWKNICTKLQWGAEYKKLVFYKPCDCNFSQLPEQLQSETWPTWHFEVSCHPPRMQLKVCQRWKNGDPIVLLGLPGILPCLLIQITMWSADSSCSLHLSGLNLQPQIISTMKSITNLHHMVSLCQVHTWTL